MGKSLRSLYLVTIQKIYFLNFNIVYKYLVYLQRRLIYKNRIILSIKKYFSKFIKDFEYNTIFPRSKISFNKREKRFLTEVIRCSIQIKDAKEEGVIQKEVFLCKLKNIKFHG